ncbi:MAG: hypothetical protein PHI19_06765, partial [Clostridia bacterium]|nr:hypothetical protein [Clostridia bacterium]
LYYISPYDKLLMLSSEYNTRLGYVSPSTGSLTSNSYYALSVWVKTVDGAKASITINNKSNVISIDTEGNDPADGDYIGYVNQDTQGKWVQYTFYIKTTKMTSPAGLQLELYLGNKYATPLKIGTQSYTQGVSKGTVFFDDVYYKKLADEAEYNRLVYGAEDPDTLEEGDKYQENTLAKLNERLPSNLFSNEYIFKLIDLTTDSFDSFTDGTSPLGGTPNAYSHYNVKDATGYTASDDLPAMLYGVYDKRSVMDEVGEYMLDPGAKTSTLFADENALRAFLTQDVGTGNNYLLLANILDNGQYYLTSDSFSLNTETYYKISFFAKLKAPAGKKAEFRFEYGNETETWSTVMIDSEEWTEYTFYVYNSDTTSVSGNQFSFYLGTNESTVEGENTADLFAGLLVIDNVTFTPLDGAEEYNTTVETYDALSAEEKAAANYGYYKFVKAETEGPSTDPSDDDPNEDDPASRVDSQLWLLISSIVIGALLVAVVVVLSWRKISKRIKKNIPVKVISNVPVNMQTKDQRKSTGNKKDIDTDEYTD